MEAIFTLLETLIKEYMKKYDTKDKFEYKSNSSIYDNFEGGNDDGK